MILGFSGLVRATGLFAISTAIFANPLTAADLVILDAKVMTMAPQNSVAQALAIDDGKIVAVGTNAEMSAFITAKTVVYALPGSLVLPGFQDSHTHLIWSGTGQEDIALFDAATKDDLTRLIRDGAALRPDEPWVKGGGWDLSAFPYNTLDAAFLDELVPDRPAVFDSVDGHSTWVNTAVLKLAGITSNTPDPAGGRIERDAAGNPTGLLREAAIALVANITPGYSDRQVAEGLKKALAEANAFGITSIIDPKAEPWMLSGYKAALDAGLLTVRVKAAVEVLPAQGIEGVIAAVAQRDAYQADLLEVNAIKLFVDGVIESKTAAMLAPYVNETFAGELLFTPEQLKAIAVAADLQKFQLHIHAIGDRAIRASLDAFEAAQNANGPRDSRHQIAHLEVIDPADIGRFKSLGVIANFQPFWAYPDSYITDLTEPVIGPERSQWLYPIGAVLNAGGIVAAGSDWSVSSMNPLDAIQVAVTRQDPADPNGRILTPQHKVTVEQMIAAYTINGAFAGFRETDTGTLEVGKLADIVVLDADITTIALTDIAKTSVLMTLLAGVPVYQSPALPAPKAPE